MNLIDRCRDRKIHTRSIEISTFEYDDEHFLVQGVLKDDILIPMYISDEKREPHSPHHMIIQMLIEFASLSIKEVKVDMPLIPYHWCKETSDSLAPLKSLKIEPGFTSKVRKILKNGKRCLHLTTLLFAMVPTIMQGHWTYNARKPGTDDISSDMIEDYLVDSCWVWRKGGPRAQAMNRSNT